MRAAGGKDFKSTATCHSEISQFSCANGNSNSCGGTSTTTAAANNKQMLLPGKAAATVALNGGSCGGAKNSEKQLLPGTKDETLVSKSPLWNTGSLLH